MPITVTYTEDPTRVLTDARAFLCSNPVAHNLILTLLEARVARPEPGRYWLASGGRTVVGVVFQSPLSLPACLTPMSPQAAEAMVDAISDSRATLPGVHGEAATAARFAGHWTERNKCPAMPVHGQRIYEIVDLRLTSAVPGQFRKADLSDRPLLVSWMRDFFVDTQNTSDAEAKADQLLNAGKLYLWSDDRPVSMAAQTTPVAGVARIMAVYTPPDLRGHGYATATVSALSKQILDSGSRCILYTDLANPTSNAIYRRLGYQAVSEGLHYKFG